MPCSCQSGSKASEVFVVTAPGGTQSSYSSEVEASAAAQRVGGTYRRG